MQVGESETVCVVDDYRVGIADVNTIANDSGGEEHVIVIVDESHDYLLKFLGLHLSVSYCDSRIWYLTAYYACYVGKVTDAVVYEEHLSVAAHLEIYGILYHL